MDIENFLKQLKAQTTPPKEKTDKDMMRIINSWRKKGTAQYKSYRDEEGKSDMEYFGHMFAKAGVDKTAGWEFAKGQLEGWYEQTRQADMKDEFDTEFDSTSKDLDWRNRAFKSLFR